MGNTATGTVANTWLATLITPTPSSPTAAAAVSDIWSGTAGNVTYGAYAGQTVISTAGWILTDFPTATGVSGNLAVLPPRVNTGCRVVYGVTPSGSPAPPPGPPPPVMPSPPPSSAAVALQPHAASAAGMLLALLVMVAAALPFNY